MAEHPGPVSAVEPAYVDPVVEAYKRDVDRSLLRTNLRKTLEERVQALMALQALAAEAAWAGRSLRRGR